MLGEVSVFYEPKFHSYIFFENSILSASHTQMPFVQTVSEVYPRLTSVSFIRDDPGCDPEQAA